MTLLGSSPLTRAAAILAFCGLFVAAGCALRPAPIGVATSAPAPGTPADPWVRLQQQKPYPFTMPLPPAVATAIDGIYTKVVIKNTPTVHCRRCPDYAPEAGVWRIQFQQGVFRVFHMDSGWPAMGSYTLSADQLVLFNDPNCMDVVGRYAWSVTVGALHLVEVDDPCAIHLRSLNLTMLPWNSCQPPNREAAISGHWLEPVDC